MLGASATMRMPREPPTRPMIIQGRRMPNGEVVRSLILPKKGLPKIANRATAPATIARLFGAWSIPTNEFTFNGKVTSRTRAPSMTREWRPSPYRLDDVDDRLADHRGVARVGHQ